ncbi:MAG: LysM peptidoglycan-binding domain-containing protein [Desulfobacteraceae bacterium]|nr:LysM peptidoglycan-binding domain-containing protein [Desulfobacteraceae bacterium]
MKFKSAIFVSLLLAAFLNCCASTSQTPGQTVALSPQLYQKKAQDLEKKGELNDALLAWRIAEQMDPDSKTIKNNIKKLKNTIAKTAKIHFRKAIGAYKKGNDALAQQQFLITLRLDPKNSSAKRYLKNQQQDKEKTFYRVKKGDSFSKIAHKFYKDQTKAHIIAYFNDIDPDKPLMIGKLLIIPMLESEHIIPRMDIETRLDSAQTGLEQKQYDTVVGQTGRIQAQIRNHQKAEKLANQALYESGLKLIQSGQPFAALKKLNQVSPKYKGLDSAIKKAKNLLKNKDLYNELQTAKRHFDQKNYPNAILITDKILIKYPGNPTAQSLFTAAHYALGKQMLDQHKDAEAFKALSVINPDYQDTSHLLAQARGRLNARAETHYRNGVKFFLNENLVSAIEQWKKVVKLNPNHPKAAQDIENALRLLNKWRDLEKKNRTNHQ